LAGERLPRLRAPALKDPGRKEQLERRLEQSRRLLKGVNDSITSERIEKLVSDLEQEKRLENEK
jgi:hypothetical protein